MREFAVKRERRTVALNINSQHHFTSYTACTNAQVAASLLRSCNNLLQQADIRMRSHGLRQLVDDKSVASCQIACCKLSTGLWDVDHSNRLVASCFNKL